MLEKDAGLRGEWRFKGMARFGGGKANDTSEACRLDSGDDSWGGERDPEESFDPGLPEE